MDLPACNDIVPGLLDQEETIDGGMYVLIEGMIGPDRHNAGNLADELLDFFERANDPSTL